ncbi:MAG: preprotein translocase subunit SecE [Betaproteobacteria bacterium]|nr:preprotein translocase subunit SecE [Betaproteobacteria bacterium]
MNALEKIKLWSAAVIVVGVVYVAGYELGAGRTAERLGVLAVGLSAAAALVIFSVSGRMFFDFVRAAHVELRKVIWPAGRDTVRITGVVVLLVSLVMAFLWVVDFILGGLLEVLSS